MEHRVLVVDDEPSMQRLFQAILHELGYLVDGVATTAEAERALMHTAYCGMLLDYQLPGEDGLRFVQRCAEGIPLPPIIFITGHDLPDVPWATAYPAIKAMVTKPCELSMLLYLTQHFFDSSRGSSPPRAAHTDGGSVTSDAVDTAPGTASYVAA